MSYNVHRWYEYGMERYTRTDPLGVTFGDISRPGPERRSEIRENLYVYVRARPTYFIDPLGLCSCGGKGARGIWGVIWEEIDLTAPSSSQDHRSRITDPVSEQLVSS